MPSKDAFNRRIAKLVDSDLVESGYEKEEWFVYDGQDVLVVHSDALTPTHRYLHGPLVDQVLAEEFETGPNAGDTLWHLADHQGTIRELVDHATQEIVEEIDFDAFGNILAVNDTPGADPTSRYAYTGREYDAETGLNYHRNRYYDPTTGRWLSEDPIGFAGGDANLYRWVGNGAVNHVDPLGRSWLSQAWHWIWDSGPRDEGSAPPAESLNERGAEGFRQRQERIAEFLGPELGPQARDDFNEANQFVAGASGLILVTVIEGGKFAIAVGSILLPGPEDAILAAVLSRRGLTIVAKGAENIFKRLDDGQEICGDAAVRLAQDIRKEIQQERAAYFRKLAKERGAKIVRRSEEVIAEGKSIGKVERLQALFGGEKRRWKKMKGWDEHGQEWHWYEHHGIGKVGMKRAGEVDPF